MKKMLCALLTAVFMLLTAVPAIATDGSGVTVSLDIQGYITSIDFGANTAASYSIPAKVNEQQVRGISSICNFSGSIGTLIIPSFVALNTGSLSNCPASTVVLSGHYALPKSLFSGNSNLVSVSLPDSLTRIPSLCFNGCTNLSSVGLPTSLEEIESGAFSGCNSLTSVNFNSNLKIIGASAFANCSSLNRITTGNKEVFPSVTSIGEYAFYGARITTLILPDSVTYIGTAAFEGCTQLTDLYIGSGIRVIPERAFNRCTQLYKLSGGKNLSRLEQDAFAYSFSNDRWDATISFGEKLNYIGATAFEGCKYIDYIEIFNGNCNIASDAFYKCSTTIKSYSGAAVENFCKNTPSVKFESLTGTPSSDEKYDDLQYAIVDNEVHITAYMGSGKNEVVIPAEINNKPVTTIDANAFMRSDVVCVVLPSSITSIKERSFAYCSALETIVILDDCKSIDSSAFAGSSSSLTIRGVANSYAKIFASDHSIHFSAITENEYKCLSGTHGETSTERKEATCDADGYERTKCKACGAVIKETKLPKRTSHEYEVTTVAPTCTEEGYTLHKCKYCDNNYKDEKKAAIGHKWEEWVVLIRPTYTSTGTKTRHCANGCKEVQTETIPMLVLNSFDDILETMETDYTVSEKFTADGTVKLFSGFAEKQDISKFSNLFDEQYNVKIVDSRNNIKTTGTLATGDKFALIGADGKIIDTLLVVVSGDLTGDGKVTAADYIAQRRIILGILDLDDAKYAAGDINKNGKIQANDYVVLRRYLLGIVDSIS